MISVAIIEDHHLVREGLVALLADNPTIRVVGEASDGATGLKLIEKVTPDVLLLDLILPSMPGFDILRKVANQVKVIALSMRADDLFVAEAVQLGARGYVTKDTSASELTRAIEKVMQGERYLCSGLNEAGVNRLLRRWSDGSLQPHETLTSREQVVLQLSADGLTSNQMADRLGISPRTVEMHRSNMMRKIGCVTQTELVRFAIRNSIISA